MHHQTHTGSTPADFLLSIAGFWITIATMDYNHIIAGIAGTLTVILTGIRIFQAIKNKKQE